VTNVSRVIIAHARSTRIYNAKCLGGVFSRGLIISEQARSEKSLVLFRAAQAGRAITNFSSRRSSRHRCLYHTRLVYNLRRSRRTLNDEADSHDERQFFTQSDLRVLNLRNPREPYYRQCYLPQRSADKLSYSTLLQKWTNNLIINYYGIHM